MKLAPRLRRSMNTSNPPLSARRSKMTEAASRIVTTTFVPRARGGWVSAGSGHDDEFALHQADDVLRGVEIGAREVIENFLELPVIEHELERIELRRRQLP